MSELYTGTTDDFLLCDRAASPSRFIAASHDSGVMAAGRPQTVTVVAPTTAFVRGGLVLSVIGVLVTASCWIDPYSLAQTPDGGLSTAWLDRAWTVAFIAPLVSIILALFGRGWSRIMLALCGGLTLLLAFGSLLQNGV